MPSGNPLFGADVVGDRDIIYFVHYLSAFYDGNSYFVAICEKCFITLSVVRVVELSVGKKFSAFISSVSVLGETGISVSLVHEFNNRSMKAICSMIGLFAIAISF